MLWLLENDLFGAGEHPLAKHARDRGHTVRAWNESWWATKQFPEEHGAVLFHGSLGNAAQIAALGRWSPGAWCNTAAFFCSSWYSAATPWRLADTFLCTTVADLARDPLGVAGHLANDAGDVFVRPDSPLKPFSGRVVRLSQVTAKLLDHGYYYDDLNLPVVVAPICTIGREWRFVVARNAVVASSEYVAESRSARASATPETVQAVAASIARDLPAPDPMYVLDIAETDAGYRLVELNPFSGADLYACDLDAVVAAAEATLQR